ncbi:MAG: DMT family transporter [Candidatus Daviesbacteria bacterium]
MPALIFAFISYFAWGIGLVFEAIAGRKIESNSATFWGLALGFILSLFYVPFALPDLSNLNFSTVVINLFVAFFWIGGTIVYYEALKKGNPSLVGTIASSFPVIVVILSILFLHETVNLSQALAIIIIFVGLGLSSLNFKSLTKKQLFENKGTFLALIVMISWGIALTFIKIPITTIGWFWPNFFVFALAPLFLIYMKSRNVKLEFPKSKIFLALIISIILVRIAEYSYNIGLSKGFASIVAPIAGANPTLFIPLAFLVFKEPITKLQIVGIIITLIGIVALSVSSI